MPIHSNGLAWNRQRNFDGAMLQHDRLAWGYEHKSRVLGRRAISRWALCDNEAPAMADG